MGTGCLTFSNQKSKAAGGGPHETEQWEQGGEGGAGVLG